MHQYNGQVPFKRVCKCGCGRVFWTIDKDKYYVLGHQQIFKCTLCGKIIDKNNTISKRMNKGIFHFCEECHNNINLL